MTGQGVSWGRDRLGRSEPAFLSANTFALPPLTCTAEGRHHLWQLLFLLQGRSSVAIWLRPVPDGESAGCVCLQCLVQQVFVCLPLFVCHAHCPHQFLPSFNVQLLCPRSMSFCLLAPVHVHVRQDRLVSNQQFASCKTVPLAAATRACSGGPCAGSIC